MFKRDIMAGLLTYSTDKRLASNLETITAERAKEIVEMNRRGEKPESLQPDDQTKEAKSSVDLLADGDIHRFDKAKKKKKKKPQRPEGDRQAKPQHTEGDRQAKPQPQHTEGDRQESQPQQPKPKKKKKPQEPKGDPKNNEPKE